MNTLDSNQLNVGRKKKIKQISSNFLCIMPVLLYFSFNFIDRLKKAMYIGRTKIQKNEEKIFICYSIFMKGFFLPDKKSAQSPNERNIWRASAVSRITVMLLEKVWINKSSMSKQCRILCQLQIFFNEVKVHLSSLKIGFWFIKAAPSIFVMFFFFFLSTPLFSLVKRNILFDVFEMRKQMWLIFSFAQCWLQYCISSNRLWNTYNKWINCTYVRLATVNEKQ